MAGRRPPTDSKRQQAELQSGLENTGVSPVSNAAEVAAFLSQAKALDMVRGSAGTQNRGRLIFALDATMSRQRTWDRACQLQAEMFLEADRISGLDIKLVYFRGFSECRASRWFDKGSDLAGAMSGISCQGGRTQIRKVLTSALGEARNSKVSAVVYVGDCMEEDIDELCARAGELGLLGVPMFLFQEGRDPYAEQAFREMARLTKGAYCSFDSGAARQLADLLKAVAVFASGGRSALMALEPDGGAGVRLLIEQMK
ncbi:VWA domain-containing protein [Roseibium algae]|uniref:VWA domain-containing protein n=1 Tax=Roseibium algae TaxID=3123038 RepID=A0ABU8TRE2_9HYPH